MPGANQYTAQEFIVAIPGSGGIITTIAARVGCAWHTAKKYIERYATVKRAYQDECNKVLDLAESNILGDLKAKEIQTSKWYLTMKGGDRGYAPIQRQEITGKDRGPIEFADVSLTDAERLAALAALGRRLPEDAD